MSLSKEMGLITEMIILMMLLHVAVVTNATIYYIRIMNVDEPIADLNRSLSSGNIRPFFFLRKFFKYQIKLRLVSCLLLSPSIDVAVADFISKIAGTPSLSFKFPSYRTQLPRGQIVQIFWYSICALCL
jgi:hypothetical protein